jgi:hypothetical protein
MTEKLLILVDYRDYFYIACGKGDSCMDVTLLARCFRDLGLEPEVKHFADISFRENNYKGWWVLYQSSEDPYLQYKSYIEDVMLGLQMQGARLIPRFECLHAHHNKVFMEILKDLAGPPSAKTIESRGYGCLEELKRNIGGIKFPVVIKPAAGQGSLGVALAEGPKQLLDFARKLSRTFYGRDFVKNIAKRFMGMPVKSLNRRKFVVQSFVANLREDYKVLILGGKYYVLRRGNRKNDFRASGSGIFEYPREVHKSLRELLEFSREVYIAFDAPILSIDVGYDGVRCHLLEFQFLHFGTFTAEKSEYFYRVTNGMWEEVHEKCQLELVTATAIFDYVTRQGEENGGSGK